MGRIGHLIHGYGRTHRFRPDRLLILLKFFGRSARLPLAQFNLLAAPLMFAAGISAGADSVTRGRSRGQAPHPNGRNAPDPRHKTIATQNQSRPAMAEKLRNRGPARKVVGETGFRPVPFTQI